MSQSPPPSPTDSALLTVKSLDDRYVLLKNIGKGSFGHVSLARVRSKAALEHEGMRAGSMVAIKTMKKKLASISDYNFLREVEFIREVRPHRFLVNVHDMFVDSVNHHFHMSMEVMEMNLYNLMKTQEKVPFAPTAVRSMLWQIICGIDHIHRHNFFHRDIKPENILVSRYTPYHNENSASSPHSQFRIKIADFGLSRHVDDRDPYTAYVSTRWYRAPEILLRCEYYSAPVDIWAFGAMAAEVANLKPLFPGSNELDQFNLQVMLLGTPGHNSLGGSWSRALELCTKLNINLTPSYGKSSNSIMLNPEHSALTDVVLMCLTWDPGARCTARDIMYHRYFAQESSIEVPRTLKRSPLRISKQTGVSNNNHNGDYEPASNRNSLFIDPSPRMPSLAASLKSNQGLQTNKSHPNMSAAGAAAAAAMTMAGAAPKDPERKDPNGFLSSTAPAKKKFGHWTNIFKRESEASEAERATGNKENMPHSVVKPHHVPAVETGYVPKIPLPQLPPLETIAASIESLNIEARSTNTTLTERMTSDSGGTTQSEWSQSNASAVPSAAGKGSTQATTIETQVGGHKALPDTPNSASSATQMPPPPLPQLVVPKTRAPKTSTFPAVVPSTDAVMHPISVVASNVMNMDMKPPSPVSDYESPACIDEHADSQLTAYERSVRDSVLLMGLAMSPRSFDSCASLEEESESPSVDDSPLVDQFGGSSSDIRMESNAFLSPDLDKGPVWVQTEELEYPVYSRLQTNSFRDRKVDAISGNIEVE